MPSQTKLKPLNAVSLMRKKKLAIVSLNYVMHFESD